MLWKANYARVNGVNGNNSRKKCSDKHVEAVEKQTCEIDIEAWKM